MYYCGECADDMELAKPFFGPQVKAICACCEQEKPCFVMPEKSLIDPRFSKAA